MIIRFSFETFAKGIYSAEQIRLMTTKQGLKFTKQGFLNCLANPFYIGKIHIPAWEDEPAQTIDGLQAPIISEETFYEV